jgi:hypothetical protein
MVLLFGGCPVGYRDGVLDIWNTQGKEPVWAASRRSFGGSTYRASLEGVLQVVWNVRMRACLQCILEVSRVVHIQRLFESVLLFS